MDQNIRVIVTGLSATRFNDIIASLDGVNTVPVKLQSLYDSVKANAESRPDLIILTLSEQWENEIRIFVSVFKVSIPPVIVIGPEQNTSLMRKAMQAGAKDYLYQNVSEVEFRASVLKQLDAIRSNKVPVDSRMTVVISPKGSSESSFIASNLAYINATLGEGRTVVLDLDLQFGSLPLYLDTNLKRSVLPALDEADSLDLDSLEAHMTQHKSGLYVAGVMADEVVLPGEVKTENVGKLLRLLNSSFTRVFINLPLHIDALSSMILAGADNILIVVEQDIVCFRNSKSLVSVLRNDLEIPDSKVNIVINRYKKNYRIKSENIEKALGYVSVSTIPDDLSAVQESIDTGEPLYKTAPKLAVSKAFLDLSEKLNGARFKARTGIIKKIFSFLIKR